MATPTVKPQYTQCGLPSALQLKTAQGNYPSRCRVVYGSLSDLLPGNRKLQTAPTEENSAAIMRSCSPLYGATWRPPASRGGRFRWGFSNSGNAGSGACVAGKEASLHHRWWVSPLVTCWHAAELCGELRRCPPSGHSEGRRGNTPPPEFGCGRGRRVFRRSGGWTG